MVTQTENAIEMKEFLFDEKLHLTGIDEYGVSWLELLSGEADLPKEGARFDIHFEGTLSGPKINGTIKGIDYLTVRADGRFMLDIHAAIKTNDGESIAVYEDGQLIPNESGINDLKLNMHFTTASDKYGWLNKVQGWSVGPVNNKNGEVNVKVYA